MIKMQRSVDATLNLKLVDMMLQLELLFTSVRRHFFMGDL